MLPYSLLDLAPVVEGSTPVLEMTSNVISSTLSRKTVTELPLAGRNAFTFARLVPGDGLVRLMRRR